MLALALKLLDCPLYRTYVEPKLCCPFNVLLGRCVVAQEGICQRPAGVGLSILRAEGIDVVSFGHRNFLEIRPY